MVNDFITVDIYDARVNVSVTTDNRNQRVALNRHITRCARKANLVVCWHKNNTHCIQIAMYSRKDWRRYKHFIAMLYSKKTENVYVASGVRPF